MISAYVKGRKVKIVLETEIQEWSLKWLCPEEIVGEIKYQFEKRLLQEVMDQIEYSVDKAYVNKLVEETIKVINIDDVVKRIVTNRIKERIEDLIK